jgi:predicted  nucleic acid-binding Zn-ribbon protein
MTRERVPDPRSLGASRRGARSRALHLGVRGIDATRESPGARAAHGFPLGRFPRRRVPANPEGGPVSEELDRLWVIHGLDEEIAGVAARVAQFPEQRRALDQNVAAEQARLDQNAARVAELVKQRRGLDREIELVDADEKKFLGQQAAVKTNAEFQALTHEIDGCKRKRSDLETRVLMIMEDEQRAGEERPALERARAAADEARAERTRAIEADEARAAAATAAAAARRIAELDGLTAPTRQRYERIHGSRGGRAVVPIAKNACGGCYRGLPPQMLAEAKKRDRLLVCDGCGRLLVFPPDGAA